MEALDKHNLAVFVRAREGYSWWFLQRDFDQVSRMAIPTVFADYNRQFEGPDALQRKLAGAEEWRINVVGLRLAPSGRRGNGGVASISYEKVVHLTDRNLPDVTTRHAASVVYEYQPKVLAKEKDRIENPFGFVVTAYRSDPEIATSPGSAAAKQ
jgi:type IV secretion system protein VirB8